MSEAPARTLTSSMGKLTMSGNSQSGPQSKKAEVLDSWEDEADDDGLDAGIDVDSGAATAVRPVSSSPPTASSPSIEPGGSTKGVPHPPVPPYGLESAWGGQESSGGTTPARRGVEEERRPDKSTAAASRLIAAGIGQKAPKRTKEQREYDQAMKIQEKKRREKAKADEERKKLEAEKAKQAVWDD